MARNKLFKRTITRVAVATATVLSLWVGPISAQEEVQKIATSIEAFTIIEDEAGEEVRAPAERVSPGGIIEYQMTYKNVSEDVLSHFVIRGDVPEATYYLSSEDLQNALAVFEVSVADIGWASPPVVRYVEDDAGILRPIEVPDEEFEALRWRLAEPIIPGEEVSATYRIRVEN